MELTPEEKRKIYEEERTRIEAQEKIKRELQAEETAKKEAQQRIQNEKKAKTRRQNRIGCSIGLGIISIGILALIIWALSTSDDSSSSPSPTTVDLKASVTFTGTQFIITNGDAFTYRDATLTVNGKYRLRNVTLDAGEVYTVGMMQFADRQGNRFTSLMKPQSFSIYCSSGSWYGSWN